MWEWALYSEVSILRGSCRTARRHRSLAGRVAMLHRLLPAALAALATFLAVPQGLEARVFTTPEAAMEAAFPKTKITTRRLYLTTAQKEEIQHRWGRPVQSRLYTVFLAVDDRGRRTGYGFLHTEKVRSKEQTLFIAVTPEEAIRSVTLVSFFEPEEYIPPNRWLRLFEGKSLARSAGDGLLPGLDIPVMSGATLTTRSCAESARFILMLMPLAKQIP